MNVDAIKERISYDAKSGLFTALVASGKRRVGDRLGYEKTDGYRMIFLGGRWVYEHRLAWQMAYGEQPAQEVDHINGDRGDNRLSNLRACSRSQNMMNMPSRGVCFHKRQKRWQASIRLNGKRTHLGTFGTEEEALAAYRSAAMELHGEFANVSAPAPKPVQLSLMDAAE